MRVGPFQFVAAPWSRAAFIVRPKLTCGQHSRDRGGMQCRPGKRAVPGRPGEGQVSLPRRRRHASELLRHPFDGAVVVDACCPRGLRGHVGRGPYPADGKGAEAGR